MAKKKERDAVVFLNEQMKLAGEVLSEAERGRLFEALRAYAIEGGEPDLAQESRLYRSIYRMMKSAQDKAIAAYEETCRRNQKNANIRWQEREKYTNASERMRANAVDANIIKYNPIQSNIIQSDACGGDGDLSDREVKGVPGVVWA